MASSILIKVTDLFRIKGGITKRKIKHVVIICMSIYGWLRHNPLIEVIETSAHKVHELKVVDVQVEQGSTHIESDKILNVMVKYFIRKFFK